MRVKNDTGVDIQDVVTEIVVGREPFSVTATADGKRLFVAGDDLGGVVRLARLQVEGAMKARA